MLGEYVGGLMAPWRRINRMEFVAALTVLSLPGFLMMMLGAMDGLGGWMGAAQDMGQSVTNGGIDNLVNTVRGVGVPAETPTAQMMNLPGVINGLFLMMMYPFVRGRLLDRGYSVRIATIVAAVVQVSVLNDILAAFVGAKNGPVPFGMALGMLTFLAYTLLSFGGSRARKVYDKGPSRHSQLDDDFPPPRF